MKNFNMTAKTTARVIGVILILTGLVFALDITVNFEGDVGAIPFSVTSPDTSMKPLGDPKTSITLRNASTSWTGTVSIAPQTNNYGFSITPSDTSFRTQKTNVTFTVKIKDTSRPVVSINHLNNTAVNVNQLFTFYDSIKDNSGEIVNIKHDYSLDGGITWDSINYPPESFPVAIQRFIGHPQNFIPTPIMVSNNFMFRVIATDRFQLSGTDTAFFEVKNNVGIYNPTKTVRSKIVTTKFSMYDLAGRRMSVKGPSKIYVKNTQHVLIVR